MRDELKELEEAVLTLAPPDAIVTGSAISPDRRYGVVLTILPSAGDYPMDDIFERAGENWVGRGGGGGAQVAWSSLDDALGVLRFADAAPGPGRKRR